MSARFKNARYMTARFSNLEKIRLWLFGLGNRCSTSFQRLYIMRPYSHLINGFAPGGTIGVMPRSSTSWQVSSPSYVRSLITAAPFGGEAQFASRARSSSASCALPPDRLKVSAKLSLAVFRWIFAFHPPRDFPIACGPFFGCAGTVWMDLDGCAV